MIFNSMFTLIYTKDNSSILVAESVHKEFKVQGVIKTYQNLSFKF